MKNIDIAKKVFREIQNEFPHLTMQIKENYNYVELNVDIPQQKGIKQLINLNLQNNDELHLSVSNFWYEWFPCTEPDRVDDYKKAVIGYINGSYRIIEYFKSNVVYKAELQQPENNSWSTVATWSQLSWPFSFNRTQVVVKNA